MDSTHVKRHVWCMHQGYTAGRRQIPSESATQRYRLGLGLRNYSEFLFSGPSPTAVNLPDTPMKLALFLSPTDKGMGPEEWGSLPKVTQVRGERSEFQTRISFYL